MASDGYVDLTTRARIIDYCKQILKGYITPGNNTLNEREYAEGFLADMLKKHLPLYASLQSVEIASNRDVTIRLHLGSTAESIAFNIHY